MQSHNIIGSNIQKIAQLFPQCVTERLGKDGKPELGIDFEKLQAELSNDIIGEGEERYQFTWPDKRAAARLANTPTTMTLRPCREESVDFDHTQNLYIEGDNLDVLKVLRETYLNKLNVIYIDPPYNTGNDILYTNDYYDKEDEFGAKYEIDEYDLPSIEEVYDEIQFVMATLGYKMDDAKQSNDNREIFHTTRNGILAYGVYDGDKFQVLEGSQINLVKPTNLEKYNKQRTELLSNGNIVLENGIYILKTTLEFNTPSGASDFVLGGSTNGWTEWKNKDGKTLDELYRK